MRLHILDLNDMHVTVLGSYTFVYNTLNYPSGNLPVTTINDEDKENLKNFPEHTLVYKMAKEVHIDFSRQTHSSLTEQSSEYGAFPVTHLKLVHTLE